MSRSSKATMTTNGHAAPPNISELARLSGYSRTTVRQRLKQGWHPDDFLPVKTTEIRQDFRGPTTPSTQKVHGAERTAVDLVQLRRDIHEWAQLHRKVEVLKVRHRRNQRRDHISWRICRFTFLVVGVAFFVMLAVAAVS
jgi:hypothetical protein